MWGSATLAMEMSRTSIKAASDTTQAMSQGLAFGVHAEAGLGLASVVLTVLWGGSWAIKFENYETNIFVTIVVDAVMVAIDSNRFGGRRESEGRSRTGSGGACGRKT